MPTKPESEPEQRVAFRVVVGPESGIDAHLHLGGKKVAATVSDISADGVLIKLDAGPLASLKIGGKVVVDVQFEGETMLLHGVVQSERAGGYGILFPARDRLGRANPLTRFERISAHLQRLSLSQRVKALKIPE
jgi:PilZ domain-containing protein